MVIKQQKLWAYYETLKDILGYYITLLFTFPLLSLGFNLLVRSHDIDTGVQGAVKEAILSGFKWYAIIMLIITLLFAVWFIFKSGRIEFTDNSVLYFEYMFSKEKREIPYEQITQCIVLANIWNSKLNNKSKRRITLFDKDQVVLEADIYFVLAHKLYVKLGDNKFRLVGDNGNLITIGKYYKIDFANLNCEEQLMILKNYCRFMKKKYKTGEQILNTK